MNNKSVIHNWLLEIHVKRDLNNLTDLDYNLLMDLYENKIDNRPNKRLLQKAIDIGLNPDLFYSKEHQYKEVIEELNKNEDQHTNDLIQNERNLQIINERLQNYLASFNIKIGDTIRLMQFGEYRNNGVVIYDGCKLVYLNTEIDDYGSLPQNAAFNILNYPISEYFANSINHNNYIVVKIASEFKLELLDTYTALEGKELEENLTELAKRVKDNKIDILGHQIYKYKLVMENSKNVWIIYSADKDLNNKLEHLQYLDSTQFEFLDDFGLFPNLMDILEAEKGTNILYDVVKDDDELISIPIPNEDVQERYINLGGQTTRIAISNKLSQYFK